MSHFLIVGLGNIGQEYADTRHNIGFMILDKLKEKLNASNFELDRHAHKSLASSKGKKLILIKPTTFMNLSGKAVNYWLKQEKIDLPNMLVITDDIALPFSKIRLRPKGSNGGHNGLGNIQEILGTDQYARLRIGVGSEFAKGQQANFVLSPFSTDEHKELPFLIDKSVDAVLSFCQLGAERAMNIVNK
jgi:PTH1 family peptidyl-tRNA hydrolase